MGLLSKNLQILRFRTDVPGNALFSVYIKYADDASGPARGGAGGRFAAQTGTIRDNFLFVSFDICIVCKYNKIAPIVFMNRRVFMYSHAWFPCVRKRSVQYCGPCGTG